MRAIGHVITWVLCLAILIVVVCLLIGHKRHGLIPPGTRTLIVSPGISHIGLVSCSTHLVDVDKLINPPYPGEPVGICGNDVVEWTAQESFSIAVQNAPPAWTGSTGWSCIPSGASQTCTCTASSSPYMCTSSSFPTCNTSASTYLSCAYWYYKYELAIPSKSIDVDPHVIMIP